MKRNASLLLLELLIMLTVFALAAALCIQVFVRSDSHSRESAAADMALLQAQTAGELLKHHRGDFQAAAQTHGGTLEAAGWLVGYDEAWNVTADNPAYFLRAEPVLCETAYLGQAKLTVSHADGPVLAELTLCWQEVAP